MAGVVNRLPGDRLNTTLPSISGPIQSQCVGADPEFCKKGAPIEKIYI